MLPLQWALEQGFQDLEQDFEESREGFQRAIASWVGAESTGMADSLRRQRLPRDLRRGPQHVSEQTQTQPLGREQLLSRAADCRRLLPSEIVSSAP